MGARDRPANQFRVFHEEWATPAYVGCQDADGLHLTDLTYELNDDDREMITALTRDLAALGSGPARDRLIGIHRDQIRGLLADRETLVAKLAAVDRMLLMRRSVLGPYDHPTEEPPCG